MADGDNFGKDGDGHFLRRASANIETDRTANAGDLLLGCTGLGQADAAIGTRFTTAYRTDVARIRPMFP